MQLFLNNFAIKTTAVCKQQPNEYLYYRVNNNNALAGGDPLRISDDLYLSRN